MKRFLGIDYGDARTGIAITDALGITAQGLETINNKGSDKIILKRLDELFSQYDVDTIVIGRPINMNGTESERTETTDKFIHKLKCKYNNMKIEIIDERLTTVAAHKTMNFLDVNKYKKKNIVDTISAVYILETYLNKMKNS
ncbi:MAG: Holliday junction DNA helicase RuvA [Clostridium sp. 26_21]|nr:MAG: Holliday junction DNA helicase RuvA [Clostridium sp. 26_21]